MIVCGDVDDDDESDFADHALTFTVSLVIPLISNPVKAFQTFMAILITA